MTHDRRFPPGSRDHQRVAQENERLRNYFQHQTAATQPFLPPGIDPRIAGWILGNGAASQVRLVLLLLFFVGVPAAQPVLRRIRGRSGFMIMVTYQRAMCLVPSLREGGSVRGIRVDSMLVQ